MPRPFDLGVVKPIRAETATSFSFPSGHTQTATSFWSGAMLVLRTKGMYVMGSCIILLTALSSPEKQLEGIESGADAYISKPFSIKFLLARAFRLIEQREKLREKFSNEPGIIHAAMYSTDRDKEFTDRLDIVLKANISRSDFSVEEFAQLMKLGRTVFYKKIRGITGYSPNEYLRIMRMKKAAELLLSEEHLTVAEVAYKVGINDPFYFSKCFKGQFGISPSVYQKGGEKTREEPE